MSASGAMVQYGLENMVNQTYYSADEAAAILRAMPEADLLKLSDIAKFQSLKVKNLEHDDLLHKGIVRILDGSRNWPRGLAAPAFITQVLKSIVSAHAKNFKVATDSGYITEQDELSVTDGNTQLAELVENPQSDICNVMYAHEMLNKLINKLATDPVAQIVASAIGERMSAKETCSKFNISHKEYDAARKRLQRVVKSLSIEEEV